jgi:diguanylate cyclase (GGDEF)-like protein
LTRATAGEPSKTAALAIIDLDRFKPVNDRFGHNAGDACLSEVAARLARAFDPQTLVARLGGDEFGVLFRAAPSEADVLRRLEQALADISRPFLWGDHRLSVGASIGVTMVGVSHHRDVSDLLAEADHALYSAKASGGDEVRVFREAGHSEVVTPAMAAKSGLLVLSQSKRQVRQQYGASVSWLAGGGPPEVRLGNEPFPSRLGPDPF